MRKTQMLFSKYKEITKPEIQNYRKKSKQNTQTILTFWKKCKMFFKRFSVHYSTNKGQFDFW